jgi:hypothetical protein
MTVVGRQRPFAVKLLANVGIRQVSTLCGRSWVAAIRQFQLVCTIATRDLANKHACREDGLTVVTLRETFMDRLRILVVFSVRRLRASMRRGSL